MDREERLAKALESLLVNKGTSIKDFIRITTGPSPIIEEVLAGGLGDYFDALDESSKYRRSEKLKEEQSKGVMRDKLEAVLATLETGQEIQVCTRTGRERGMVHSWAREKGLIHFPVKSELLQYNAAYKCKECKQVYYQDEMTYHEERFMTINPGAFMHDCYHCPNDCGSHYNEDCTDEMAVWETFNGVAIMTQETEEIRKCQVIEWSKSRPNHKKRRRPDSDATRPYNIDQLPDRMILRVDVLTGKPIPDCPKKGDGGATKSAAGSIPK